MTKKNIFIFIADSLRFDHVPESIVRDGTLVRGLAPSLHTPVSFPSLITSKSPENHEVRAFEDTLSKHHQTIFDFFENGSFYDNELDPVRNTVLRHTPEAKELEEMEEPFVYIERAMDTHIPYGEMKHGNDVQTHRKEKSEEIRDKDDIESRYKDGVKSVEEHFWSHVKNLEERGLRENTLIIFASDHGELLGERMNLRKRYAHVHPMSKELVEVPIVFLDSEMDENNMRLIDVAETALQKVKNQSLSSDGVNIEEENKNSGKVIVDGYVSYENKWIFSKDIWAPESWFKLKRDVFKEDLRILTADLFEKELFDRPGSPNKEIGLQDLDI